MLAFKLAGVQLEQPNNRICRHNLELATIVIYANYRVSDRNIINVKGEV